MPRLPQVINGEHVIFHPRNRELWYDVRPDMEPQWHVQHGDLIEVHGLRRWSIR